ncbi:hypothetical protein CHS0354_020473 [Potamilus streckersoni]|uniref:Uncharacterized protein n=1 Tax=Potamilus streckersoni TaxID=2493646 RepID=A0AAE0W453_9BIVA|nr:hypothetical protein CHS0354_020473 [Potamilus streckersoni]
MKTNGRNRIFTSLLSEDAKTINMTYTREQPEVPWPSKLQNGFRRLMIIVVISITEVNKETSSYIRI